MFRVLLYFNRLYVLDATQYSAFIGAGGGGGGRYGGSNVSPSILY